MAADPIASARLIVFTDLDGTLLDHATYSAEAARPALAKLAAIGAPVVLASSKTAAEMGPIRETLGLGAWPAIVENGGGVLAPEDDGSEGDDDDYRRLRAALEALPRDLRERFEGFGDWTVDGIASRTGLPAEDAAAAARRRHSEPGVWNGDDGGLAQFEAALAERGITARRGGRFLTLSFGATKADRMKEIAPDRATTIALGDAPNDAEMIETADYGVVVANPEGASLPRLAGEADGRVRRTEAPGPKGWNEAVLAILQDLNPDD